MARLREASMRLAEHARVEYVVEPEEGTKFEDMLKPEYWAHVARNLRPGTEITVQPVEGDYYARLYVRDAGANWAKVAKIAHVEFDGAVTEVGVDDRFKIERKGFAGYCIIRKQDKAVISQGHKTAADAQLALAEHLKGLAA